MAWKLARPAIMAGLMLSSTAGAASAMCVRGVASWDTLRVRAAPASAAREVGAVPANACGITMTGACHGGWCPIGWRGRRGWSNAAYLTSGGLMAVITSPLQLFAPSQPVRASPPPRVARVQRPPAKTAVQAAAGPPLQRAVAITPPLPLPSPPPVRRSVETTASLPPAPPAIPAPAVQTATPQAPIEAVPLAMAAAVPAAIPSPGPQPKFTAPLVAAGEVCVVAIEKGDTLKVRAGPGSDQPLRYGYPAGACGVKITGACADGWCPVDYRTYRGWAEQKFLQ